MIRHQTNRHRRFQRWISEQMNSSLKITELPEIVVLSTTFRMIILIWKSPWFDHCLDTSNHKSRDFFSRRLTTVVETRIQCCYPEETSQTVSHSELELYVSVGGFAWQLQARNDTSIPEQSAFTHNFAVPVLCVLIISLFFCGHHTFSMIACVTHDNPIHDHALLNILCSLFGEERWSY